MSEILFADATLNKNDGMVSLMVYCNALVPLKKLESYWQGLRVSAINQLRIESCEKKIEFPNEILNR